jgi:hypothetical protein
MIDPDSARFRKVKPKGKTGQDSHHNRNLAQSQLKKLQTSLTDDKRRTNKETWREPQAGGKEPERVMGNQQTSNSG